MARKKWIVALTVLAVWTIAVSAFEQTVKYGVSVGPGPMDSILLKDYQPESSLVVPETFLAKARFPVIDSHTHSSMNGLSADQVAAWVRTMDETGVAVSVVFTDAIGKEFDRQADLYQRHPGRFAVYCSLDLADFDAPDFQSRAVAELERCQRHGARGVGEVSDKGWGLVPSSETDKAAAEARPRDKRLHADDPRLDAIWEKCAELKLPVNIHIADHPSCWRPLGPHQERTPDFQLFNLYGKDVPSYAELLATRDRMLAKHPRTTFVAAHLGNQGNDLAALSKVLDRYPNLYVDISARDYELGREPRTARKFLDHYQDRVLFGTDMGRETGMYRAWWRLLETEDEFLPGRIWWRLYGLDLSSEVLKKLYRDNASRVLNVSPRALRKGGV
jgi:uncharacterized protein